MREKHYKKKLLAFLNRELTEAEQQLVGEHIFYCKPCRREHDEIKFGINLAKNLKRMDAPNSVWQNIEKGLNVNHPTMHSDNVHVGTRKMVLAFASVIALVVVTSILYFFTLSNPKLTLETSTYKPSLAWQVEKLSGKLVITNSKENKSLSIGGTLETDSKSSAKIEVADIGQVKIAPNSLVKLVNSSKTEHRLSLERGALEAQIYAPPRLFVVDTPSAVAVDLGCAYKLEVDGEGNSKLHVTSGYVSLERKGRESFVPAGAFCLTKRGIGLGTPFFDSASPTFRKALMEFDFGKSRKKSLRKILSLAKIKDTLTLWHLLSRVTESEREKIFNKLYSFVKLPDGVTRKGILRLDKQMLETLKNELETRWYD